MQARKALKALRGLVKLQALVRGHLVRKQATATLRCMQALVTAQARARAQRIQAVDEGKISNHRQSTHRRSSQEKIKHIHPVSMLLFDLISFLSYILLGFGSNKFRNLLFFSADFVQDNEQKGIDHG